MLSNYNIKYICTIYTRLYTCLTSITRFALREKVTLRLLKLLFQGVDVVEWSRALDMILSDLFCSLSMVWVQISRGKNTNVTAQKSNSNTVWFNFNIHIYINVWKSSQRMNLRDVGSETSVNDSVQTNKNDK